ncbi:MAG: SH3 domain-containing protein [Muribaculaceae bacterium]|nr:SH3 domain-containing protein [Muribaculaceae bacterium]
MKKLAFLLIALLAVMTANAQEKGYVCTGNNVNIRTGAGVKYPVMDDGNGHKRQMSKGDVVLYRGQKKNGFCLVIGPLEWGGDEREGWVSQKYLRPVTLCPTCGGTKDENIAEVDIELVTCRKCKGKGYIKKR